MVEDQFWNKAFLTLFFTHFWSQNGPFSRHFAIFHWPTRVNTGPKCAKNTCLSIPNGLGSLLEEHIVDPFLTHFCSQNGVFSRHFGIYHVPKRVTTGSKQAKNARWSIPSGGGSILEKCAFDPFFVPKRRIFKAFWDLVPKRVTTGSKQAKNACWSIPSGGGSILEKCAFDPFCVPNRRSFKAFCDFLWAHTRQHGLKMGLKALFEHPKWRRINFGKMRFLTLFSPIFGPKTGPFQGILRFSICQNASTPGQNGLKTLVWASQMV